jgi:hypothetical protein
VTGNSARRSENRGLAGKVEEFITAVSMTAGRSPAALGEISRVLAPGGRLLIVERLRDPGAHGHVAHGLTRDQAERLAGQVTAAGFTEVLVETRRLRRRTLLVVRGSVSASVTQAA